MIPVLLWVVLGGSLLTSIKAAIDFGTKSMEAARAHEEDLVGKVSSKAAVRTATRKERFDFVSAFFGIVISVLGAIVASFNLVWPSDGFEPAPDGLVWLTWGAWLALVTTTVVWMSISLARRPKAVKVKESATER